MSADSTSVLLLGFTIPDELAKEVFLQDKLPQIATHKFAWSLARALKVGFTNIVLGSAVPVQNYPHSKRIIFRSREFVQDHMQGLLLGFVNVILIKHISRLVQCLYRVPRFMRRHDIDTIILHGTHTPFMVFAILMTLWKKRIFILLTDQHGKPVSDDRWYDRALKKLDTWFVALLLGRFDGYICLSNAFSERLSLHKPVFVFPGILNSDVVKSLDGNIAASNPEDTYNVVFAGGVSKSNGVDRLLEAIAQVDDSRLRVTIYGRGELERRVIGAGLVDSRILYGGLLLENDVIPALASASLLINPRPIDREYAQTSFPSKLIEYLATGRPVLTTRIASIPPEMEDCFLYIDDATADGIADSLQRVIHMPTEVRENLAKVAQKRVQSLYSEAVIGEKIRAFFGEHLE